MLQSVPCQSWWYCHPTRSKFRCMRSSYIAADVDRRTKHYESHYSKGWCIDQPMPADRSSRLYSTHHHPTLTEMSVAFQSPNSSFRKSKGHVLTKNRKKAHIRTKHIDVEGTVYITFSPDGLLIHESISWDGEKDVTRVVLLPADSGEENAEGGSSGIGDRAEGKGEVDGGCRERDVDEMTREGEERPADYQPSAVIPQKRCRS
ncbi:hypothetical protein CPB85DRAFT_135866 [Mucidula mucida]|nr:hypothetical protein CPB85DRAFT_135866 [Mucidula mucida]